MNNKTPTVGRVSDSVTRQGAENVEAIGDMETCDVGLRCANPTYETGVITRGLAVFQAGIYPPDWGKNVTDLEGIGHE